MISKHIECEPQNDNFRRLANYIVVANHEGEKLLTSWCEGCYSGDDFEFAMIEILDTQGMNTRSQKEKTYHLMISFRPEDEQKLSPDVFKYIEKRFADVLGFGEHQRICGVHKNTDNIHMHIAYNMINKEKYTDQDSFIEYVKEHKGTILEDLKTAENWQEVHNSFSKLGIQIKPQGAGLIIQDLHGQLNVKASIVDRSLSIKRLQDRLGTFVTNTKVIIQPQQKDKAKTKKYQPKPIQKSVNSKKLWIEFIKDSKKEAVEAIRNKWTKELEGLKLVKMTSK